MTRKSILLWGVLLITLWLSWHTYQQEQSQKNSLKTVLPTRIMPQQHGSALMVNQTSAQPLQLSMRQSVVSQVDLFTAIKPITKELSFKNSQQPLKIPPPTAPPLPFKYLGRIQIGNSNGVLLSINNEVTPIQTGDILLGQYKVQAISEAATGVQIQFLYQPLNLVQTLTGLTTN